MKNKIKPAAITGVIFGVMSYYGATQTGGDGFFNDPNQAPVGADPVGIIFMVLLGAGLGALPWRSIGKKLFNRK